MLLYTYILLSTQIAYIINKHTKGKYSGRLFLFLFIQTFAVSALRSKYTGVDNANYVNIFMSVTTHVEYLLFHAPAYTVYMYILYKILPFEQTILIFNSFITLACIFYFIKFFSDDVYLSLFAFIALGFFFGSLGFTRQYLALSLLLLATTFMYSGKVKFAVLFSFLGCTTHVSVIILLPLLWLFYHKKISNKIFLLIIIMVVAVPILFDSMLNIFLKVFPIYKMYVNGSGDLEFAQEGPGQGRIFFLYIFYLLIVLLSVFAYFYSKKKTVLGEKLKLFSVPVTLSCIVGFLGVHNPLFNRLALNFSIFIVILIPCCLKAFTPRSKSMMRMLFIATLFIPFYVLMRSNIGNVLPYHFFL